VRAQFLLGAGYVALARQQLDDAEKYVSEAREYARARGMNHLEPELALAEARISRARGERDSALDHFARAEKIANELQMRPAVWQARAGASQVLRELGRVDEANAQRDTARATINEIATLFRDENLRGMFLENVNRDA